MDEASDDAASRIEPRDRTDDPSAGQKPRARERNRQYRQADPDRHAASTRRWKEAHPERVRELHRQWRADNLERARELNRESMRRAAERKRRLEEKRRRNNEASGRWKEAHPEHVRAYHLEWTAANRDKVNEYYRRYRATHRQELNGRATAWRDSQPETIKRARKAWADRNKKRTTEIQGKRRSDPEKYRADLDANSAAKRLARRLERAGLPPKRVHRTTAAERRGNDKTANIYFDDPALPERLRQFTVFTVMLTEEVLTHGDRMLDFAKSHVAARARMGLPPVDPDQIMYARAAQSVTERLKRVDLLTSREVAAAVRSAKSTAVAAAEERRLKSLVDAVDSHVQRHRTRLAADADLENRARTRVGKPLLPTELLVIRSAADEVLEESASGILRDRSVSHIAAHVERAVLANARGYPWAAGRLRMERLPDRLSR